MAGTRADDVQPSTGWTPLHAIDAPLHRRDARDRIKKHGAHIAVADRRGLVLGVVAVAVGLDRRDREQSFEFGRIKFLAQR